MKNRIIRIVLLFFLFPFQLISQEISEDINEEIMAFYNEVASYYSTDDELLNGISYHYPNNKIHGNPYLKNEKWNTVTLFNKERKYSGIQLKYDLVIDKVIIKATFENGIEKLINVNKLQVDSFILDHSLFINSSLLFPDGTKRNYFEQIFKGRISMYRTYDKRFIDMYDDRFPAGKFSILNSNLYLFEKNSLYNISNLNSFLRYFSKENRKKIKHYLKNNNVDFKEVSKNQLEKLMEYCNTLIIN